MNMQQFTEIIKNDLEKINVNIESLTTICISTKCSNLPAISYYFVDDHGYHCITNGDRGKMEEEFTCTELEDILYKLYEDITTTMSIAYAKEHRKSGEDWRRLMFRKQLELLKNLGEEYHMRCQKAIKNILQENPYDDTFLF